MGGFDSGTIENNTIYGGTIQLYFGPWQISGNKVLGAVKGTLSDGAFAVSGGHDISMYGNTVTNANPTQNGGIDRFFVANNSGYNFNLTLNAVGDNVGMPAPNPNGPSSGNPRNNPEEILFEDYRKTFEGSVLATAVSSSGSTSNNRRVVAIPTSELALFSGGEGTSGLTLTVLDGPSAGISIPVLQSFNSGQTPTPTFTYFLLATSLPQGTFDLDISPAFYDPVIYENDINTSGTISTGLVLTTTIINAQITYNTFIGDQSSEAFTYGNRQSQAIRFELHGAKYGAGAESYSVISATIDHNTIVNAIGGITMDLDTGLPTTYGRTYGFATLTNNTFEYSYQNPSVISINVTQVGNTQKNVNNSYSTLVNGFVVYNPAAANFVDPRTLSINSAGNYTLWTNGSAPATDSNVNAAEINGVLYEANANPNPPLLPTSQNGSVAIAAGSSSPIGSFSADADYSGGNTFSTTSAINTSGITNPPPQVVLQTERYDSTGLTGPNSGFSYNITGLMPNASYNVRLDFSENYAPHGAIGSRVFEVAINKVIVLHDFDIFATTGSLYKAVGESFQEFANGSGAISIQFTSDVGQAKVNAIEITPFIGPVAPTDLAQGKPVYSSSVENSSYGPGNAVDGNSSTRWSSGQWMQPNSTGWIYVDLGSVQPIGEVKLNWQAAYAVNYQIQVSNDANTWTTVDTITGNSSSGVLDYSGLAASGRYVRIYCTQTSTGSNNYSLFDFNVFT